MAESAKSGEGEPDTKEVEALAGALNHSAERVQTLWFSFLTFMVYLAIATGTTTHRMLFLESPLNLPVLNISLPLLGFYILTPIIFVIFHFYMLLNLVLLARTAKSFEDALERAFPQDGEARETFRMRIENTLFVQLLVGGRLEREGINAKTKRLAWQERKAESFTVSPRHCGSALLGFRPSGEYGDHPGRGGISLGTAMAISGAPVSPNMGYHSSPSVMLLLTLFNVRLGWWLGNPGEAGDASYQSDGPKWAAKPLLWEAFGQTTDESRYVYLSDGGHFENLGLYEMVRRRCRFIVVIDAGCDPNYAFEDLGNAVRKIYIDLGIRVQFDDLQTLRNRPSEKAMRRESTNTTDEPRKRMPYYAIGTIEYKGTDDSEPGCENGYILYIKPAYHGTEGARIRSYATAHLAFPHESTADQWFTESQFESYRSLGLDIANDILSREIVLRTQPSKLTLSQLLSTLDKP